MDQKIKMSRHFAPFGVFVHFWLCFSHSQIDFCRFGALSLSLSLSLSPFLLFFFFFFSLSLSLPSLSPLSLSFFH